MSETSPGIGHNQPPEDKQIVATDRLRSLVSRIEKLAEERKALSSDIRDIYTEAKSAGFDTAVLRQLIRTRAMDAADVEEREMLLDLYRRGLGM